MKKKRKLKFIKTEYELLLFGITLLMSFLLTGCSTNPLADFFFESNSSSTRIHSTPSSKENPMNEGHGELEIPTSKQEVDPIYGEPSKTDLDYSTGLYDDPVPHDENVAVTLPPSYMHYIRK